MNVVSSLEAVCNRRALLLRTSSVINSVVAGSWRYHYLARNAVLTSQAPLLPYAPTAATSLGQPALHSCTTSFFFFLLRFVYPVCHRYYNWQHTIRKTLIKRSSFNLLALKTTWFIMKAFPKEIVLTLCFASV